MAGIDLDAQFFKDVSDVISVVGEPDKVLARAVRFIQLAQERYADGKIITVTEYHARGFLPEFIGIIAEMVDENSIMATRAEEQFEWLRKRRKAAAAGGLANARRVNSDSSKLAGSKKDPNQIPSSSSFSSPPKKNLINSFLKDLSYEDAASKIIAGTRRFGPDESAKLAQFLGDDLWGLLLKGGGPSRVRQMKGDQWLTTNIIKLLKIT